MATASPPVLPITQPTTTVPTAITTTDTTQSNQPPSAFRQFISSITETVRSNLSNRRPWSELVDRTAFSKPESVSDATLRIRKNYAYFRINYLTIITGITLVSLLTNPFSLILLSALLAAWLFLYLFRSSSDPPLTLFGRQFSDRETLGGLILATVVVIFLTSVGSVLISALLVGVVIVCAHGAFRVPEDLFLDEQDNPASGFLSFFTASAASNAAAAAAPAVAARV